MTITARVLPGCTGMGSCVRHAPAVFRMDPATGKAVVLLDDVTAYQDGVFAAARSCPFVGVAIDGVTQEEPISDAAVVGLHHLTHDIAELRVRCPGLTFEPGQYVFLRLRDTAGEFFRTYSVVSNDAGVVTLCIRLLPHGRAGAALIGIAPGTSVGLSRAKGDFILRSPDQPKLFVTGGTGLAPVLPMCQAAPQARKLVLIGARTPRDLFWLDRLRAIPNTTIITTVQEPDTDWTGRVGLITNLLDNVTPADWPEVYTCGSPGMVDAVQKRLIAQHFEATRIHSDSFLPAGTKPAAPSGPTPAPSPRRDWPGLIRRAHYMASAPLAMILLFYAITGFIANRSDLFIGEDGSTPPARQVPATVPLTHEALAPFYAGMLPTGARLDGWGEGQPGEATFRAADRGWRVRVVPETRAVDVQAFGTIPSSVEKTPAAIAACLAQYISGTPNVAQAETDATSLSLDFESVWGTHRVTVDTAAYTWTSISTTPHIVVALVDLHRGKHAGAWQKIVIDVAALVLALITLSGMAMGLMAAARRRQAAILLGFSAVLLVLLILNR